MPLTTGNLIGLNVDTLKRLDYHWFWGLWYNTNATVPTKFSLETERLLSNAAWQSQIKDSQEELRRNSPLVQFFYWLFNINNYTYHAYVRAAAEACQRHVSREEDLMPMEAGYGWARQRIINVLNVAQHIVAIPFTNKADTQDALPAARAINHPSLTSTQDTNPRFCVTALMLPHLAALGIEQEVGAELSFKDFKLTCRQQRLATHPDTGGIAEKFCTVNAAIEALTRLILSPETVLLSDTLAALASQINKLKSDMTAAIAALKAELAADIVALKAELAADIAALKATAAAHKERLAILEAMLLPGATSSTIPSNAAALGTQGVFPPAGSRTAGAAPSSDPRPPSPGSS